MSDWPQLHVPVNIFTETEGPVTKQQIQGYIGHGRKMLLRMSTGRGIGVDFLGQSVTLPDGTEIKVGYYDNEVAPTAWMRISAKSRPVAQEAARDEDSSDYLWIGMRQIEAPDLCDTGNQQPTRLMLWVWEPPADASTPSQVLSRWMLEGINDDPLLPEPTQPFPEHDNLWRTDSGMYFISRASTTDSGGIAFTERERIKSPVTEDEDGDDLWDEVCIVDPKDGETLFNEDATKTFYGRGNPSLAAEFGALAALPTYYIPGDPDMPVDGVAPEEHLEKIEATVLPADREVTQKTYMIKVFYRSLYCESLGPARGKLKIISGKFPHMIINRYEFQINRPNWKERAVMPLGTGTESGEVACDAVTVVPAGDNRMDYGWSAETWEASTIGGTELTQAVPYGLNEGDLVELPCWCPSDPYDFEIGVEHLGTMTTVPGSRLDAFTYCAAQYQHTGQLVAGALDIEVISGIAFGHVAVDDCGRPRFTRDEVRAAFSAVPAGEVIRYDGAQTGVSMSPGQSMEIYDTGLQFWSYYFWRFLGAQEIACGGNVIPGRVNAYIESISSAPVEINDDHSPVSPLHVQEYGSVRLRYDGTTNTISPR